MVNLVKATTYIPGMITSIFKLDFGGLFEHTGAFAFTAVAAVPVFNGGLTKLRAAAKTRNCKNIAKTYIGELAPGLGKGYNAAAQVAENGGGFLETIKKYFAVAGRGTKIMPGGFIDRTVNFFKNSSSGAAINEVNI